MKLSVSILFRFFLSTFFLVTSTAKAKIIRVPQDQPTIQAGIDAAVDGDTVLVDTGTYMQSNISFNENRILVGSRFVTTGDTSFISQTIIDGDGTGHVIYFNGNEDSTSVLSGFTITNGSAFGQEKPYGGGISCLGSNPIFLDVKISDNESLVYGWGMGGGVYLLNSSAEFERAAIVNNTSGGVVVGRGAGIFCRESRVSLTNTTVSGNTAEEGRGIYCDNGCDAFIVNTIL